MPSPASHAVFALALAPCFCKTPIPKRVCALGALCAALPDLDIIGFHYGIRYGDFWGHRGFTRNAARIAPVVAAHGVSEDAARIAALEAQVQSLRDQLATLQSQFAAFQKQFQ